MKKITLLAAAIACVLVVPSARAGLVAGFDDIRIWVGEGENRSALVLDWNDGKSPQSYVWGYRWNPASSPTGADLFAAVLAADPFLTRVSHPDFDATFGLFYDANRDGSTFMPGTPGDEGGTTTDPTDHYQEGWFTGFWEYSVFGGNFEYDIFGGPPDFEFLGSDTYDEPGSAMWSSVSWFPSGIGAADRDLVDGSWDGYRFAAGFVSSDPEQPVAAVPEPASALLLGVGLIALFAAGRSRKKI